LIGRPATVVIRHEYDGHVACRWVSSLKSGVLSGAELPLELAHGCTSCTIRDDLLVLLCRLHRRDGDGRHPD